MVRTSGVLFPQDTILRYNNITNETSFAFQNGDVGKIVFNKSPFILSESRVIFTPEFERTVDVDSIVFDWQNTVEKVVVFGEEHKFKGETFKPTISLMRVFGIERNSRDEQQNRLVKILSKKRPRILLIHGHGGQKEGKWLLSSRGFGEELVDVEEVLTGPVKTHTQKKSYDLIVIDACSNGANGVGNYEFPQSVVNEVGVPIYYIQGVSRVSNKVRRKLVEPVKLK